MNHKEMTAEIWKDYAVLIKRTLSRLIAEYHRERKKKKIEKDKTYQRCYPIRTAAKNNWLVFIEKCPSVAKYKSEDDIGYCAVLYHHGPKGIQVFKPLTNSGSIIVYNGHLFMRYNERLQLNLTQPLDIVKRFFANSGYSDHTAIEKNNRWVAVGVCREGILLGEYKEECKWMINKTFVSREIYYRYQKKAEKGILSELKKEINEAISKDMPQFMISYKANVLAAITEKRA